jgi:hypothetical protein
VGEGEDAGMGEQFVAVSLERPPAGDVVSRGCRAAGSGSGSGSKRRSRGARGCAAQGHATREPRCAGAGRREPRLRSESRSRVTERRRSFGPSGRGGRAERAHARPHVARRGSAALSQAIRASVRMVVIQAKR